MRHQSRSKSRKKQQSCIISHKLPRNSSSRRRQKSISSRYRRRSNIRSYSRKRNNKSQMIDITNLNDLNDQQNNVVNVDDIQEFEAEVKNVKCQKRCQLIQLDLKKDILDLKRVIYDQKRSIKKLKKQNRLLRKQQAEQHNNYQNKENYNINIKDFLSLQEKIMQLKVEKQQLQFQLEDQVYNQKHKILDNDLQNQNAQLVKVIRNLQKNNAKILKENQALKYKLQKLTLIQVENPNGDQMEKFYQQELELIQGKLISFKNEIQKMKLLEKKIKYLKNEVSQREKQLLNIKQQHQNQIYQLTENYTLQIEQLKQLNQNKLSKVTDKKLHKIKEKYQQKMKKQSKNYELKILQIQDKINAEKQNQQAIQWKQREYIQSQIQNMKDNFNKKRKEWKQIYDELLQEIRNLKKEIIYLGEENQSLKSESNGDEKQDFHHLQ